VTQGNDTLDEALGEGPCLDGGDGERIRGNVEAALFGAAPPSPQRIGKYRVAECVGAGAMGRVFAAYDDVLDRKVALKLVRHQRASPSTMARLIQEAKSLARLDHPNVVRVHEAGFVDERAWIAMQFVEGCTLREWFEGAPRSVGELLDTLHGAGRGLAAAHEAGLVHRDFKPDNVLVSEDNAVRVVDFGLVHIFGETDPARTGPTDDLVPEGVRGLLEGRLTREGAVMGTPVYMPPEQLRGGRVDARSDQFSFCVTCWEALFGNRPFSARTADELLAATENRRWQPPSDARRVPKRIERALQRGLSARPDHRFENMDALLAALEASRRPRRAWMLAASGAALAVTIWRVAPDDASACSGAPEMADVWSEGHAVELRRAFEASELPFADKAGRESVVRLDARVMEWRGAQMLVCNEADAPVRDIRQACLERQRLQLEATVRHLQTGARPVVENAVDLIAGLPDAVECLGFDTTAEPSRASDPELLRMALDAEMHAAAGQSEDAQRLATSTLQRARERTDVLMQIAALRTRGKARLDLSNDRAAVDDLMEAINLATTHELDSEITETWIDLTHAGASVLRDEAKTREWSERAAAWVERTGEDPTAGRFDLARAHLLLLSDPKQATSAFEAVLVAQLDPNSAVAREARVAKAAAALAGGDFQSAEAQFREILHLRESRYGVSHPATAMAAYNLGAALDRLGSEQAPQFYNRALHAWAVLYPEGNGDVAMVHIALGNIDLKTGDVPWARAHAESALRILRRLLDPNDTRLGEGWTLVGAVEHAEGRYEPAALSHEKARGIYERKLGAEHMLTAVAESNLGEALLHLRRYRDARAAFEHSAHVLTTVFGEEHPYLAFPRKGLGLVALASGETEGALPLLESARELMGEIDPIETLEIDGALAWALHRSEPATAAAILSNLDADAQRLGASAVRRLDTLEGLVAEGAAPASEPATAASTPSKLDADTQQLGTSAVRRLDARQRLVSGDPSPE